MIRTLLVTALACGALVACAKPATTATANDEASCRGVVESEGGPLAGQEIEDVAPLYDLETVDKVQVYRLRGAEVTVAAKPGTSSQQLARQVQCHIASHASAAGDPLASATSATVRPTENGYAVEIRGENKDQVHEILRRSNQLAGAARSSTQVADDH
jgi:hypothetical protein